MALVQTHLSHLTYELKLNRSCRLHCRGQMNPGPPLFLHTYVSLCGPFLPWGRKQNVLPKNCRTVVFPLRATGLFILLNGQYIRRNTGSHPWWLLSWMLLLPMTTSVPRRLYHMSSKCTLFCFKPFCSYPSSTVLQYWHVKWNLSDNHLFFKIQI
jgi:hypothetical protein